MLNHPDMGGNIEVMKKINIEFEQIKKQINSQNQTFGKLAVGDVVVVNGSDSHVISVNSSTFTARSIVTQRQAIFSKSTGICINNKKFKAYIPKMINNGN